MKLTKIILHQSVSSHAADFDRQHRSLNSSSLPNLASTLYNCSTVFLAKHYIRISIRTPKKSAPSSPRQLCYLQPQAQVVPTVSQMWHLWDPAFATSNRNLPSLPGPHPQQGPYSYTHVNNHVLSYVGCKCDVLPCRMCVCVRVCAHACSEYKYICKYIYINK